MIGFAPPFIDDEEINEVVDTLRKGWLSQGPKVNQFEVDFARYVGSKYAVAVDSCTSALFLSLYLQGVKEGDEVITTPLTFASTANVICHLRAKPIFVDVDKDTWNIDADKIKDKITEKTKGIIAVHYAGQPCDMDKINRIARENKLFVIEDAAHALSSEYRGKKVGNSGNLVCFSFYPTKPITTGEGGMITTNNLEFAERLKSLRLHGISKGGDKRYTKGGDWHYEILDAGFKMNTNDLSAAIGIHQLKKIGMFQEKRERIAKRYIKEFSKFGMVFPKLIKDVKTSRHIFPVLVSMDRSKFIEKLKEREIIASVHFIPLHLHPYYSKMGYKKGDFPVAEKIYKHVVSIPLYPKMTDDDVDYVIKSVTEILGNENIK